MKFNASNDRIYIQDDSGNYVFDTNMKMPAIIEIITKTITLTEVGTILAPVSYERVLYLIKDLGYTSDFMFSTLIINTERWGNITANISGSLFYEPVFNGGVMCGNRIISTLCENNKLYLEEERGFYYYRGKELWYTLPAVNVTLTVYVGRFV